MSEYSEIKITNSQMPEKDADTILSFVRRAMKRNYSEIRIVGMRITNMLTKDVLESINTFPGSTDLVIDLSVKLARAAYDVTPLVRSSLGTAPSSNSGPFPSSLSEREKGSDKIGMVTLIKKFGGKTQSFTYKDLEEYFKFFGVDPNEVLFSVIGKEVELELVFYVREISGLQTMADNAMVCSYVLDPYAVPVVLPAEALTGIMINSGIEQTNGYLLLCGYNGDTRLPVLQQKLKQALDQTVALWNSIA